jgi:predicted DCC family thiol-disulfide oxidoreductase YuxK
VSVSSQEALVLYDGTCGFCSRTVRWLVARDTARHLRYAPLQGQTAAELRGRGLAIPDELSSLVLVSGEEIWLRSRAVFRIMRRLPWPWRALSWLGVLPTWLTDGGYRLVARSRYRLGGRADVCELRAPEERVRFLP